MVRDSGNNKLETAGEVKGFVGPKGRVPFPRVRSGKRNDGMTGAYRSMAPPLERIWTGYFHGNVPEEDREYILGGPSYGTVHRLASGIRRLRAFENGKRATLCLCTDNKALLAAAFLAAVAGGPRLVLPYAFSRHVLEEVLETIPVAAFLTDRPEDVPPGREVLLPAMITEAEPFPEQGIDADEPFLMLFTGGSTGVPKVWAKTPRNMVEEARYMIARFGITADDLFLSTVPPRHIYGFLFSILVPLIASARVLEGIYVFPREIMKTARASKASILISVPSCYRVLKGDGIKKHSLRLALSSAGALDPGDADYFREKVSLDIHEIYGSTETGGVAIRCRGIDGDAWNALEPVTWRVAEGRIQVLSPFISPSLPRNEAGFFVTSDRAEEGGDGRFLLRGRADDVIKIGGKRVDLAEIREKMMTLDGVHDALVTGGAYAGGGRVGLVALVVTDADPAVLRHSMAALVEPYAMPRRLVVVDKIPVTATGKYDRAAVRTILEKYDLTPS